MNLNTSIRACALLAAGFLLVPTLTAQTLELKSGDVLIGRVVEVGDASVRIAVGYPDGKTLELARADLTPVSQYTVLAGHADASDPKAHLRLAEAALDLGLPAHAIAEYREAARLDGKLRTLAEQKAKEIRVRIAGELLTEAKDALAEARDASARLAAQSILDRYADTPQAADAREVVAQLDARAGKPSKQVSAKELEAALQQAARHVRLAEQTGPQSAAHGTTKAQRRLQTRVQHLEHAWPLVADLVASADATQLADRLSSLREDLRKQLIEAYLELGTVYVQRRAFPDAERYCEKACDLDPQGKGNHELHRLILQGKITSGQGY